MGESVFVLLVLMGIIAITAVVFGIWIIVSVIRLLFRGAFALFSSPKKPVRNDGYVCGRRTCRALNPTSARFCHRCGQQIAENSTYRLKVA